MFRGLLVVVVLGFGRYVFVVCFSSLVLVVCGDSVFFWFDLCFRFLCLLIACGCVCFSLRLSVLGGLLLGLC